MTIFDFDKPVERRNTDSYKWDTPESQNVQPMWVADMDFRTAPCVIDALRKVVDRGIYGYTYVPDEFYKAADRWFGSRHGNPVDRDMVIYTSGVVPAVSAVIKALTNPGDEVALLTPAYDCFFSSIRNNRCKVAECRMKVDANGKYIIDFEALESILSSECVKAFVLCNPHNPGGRVWSAEELSRIGEICIRNDVWVISDDIHCEFVYPPYRYTPVVTLDKDIAARTVQCLAPSKAFNTAGLQIALIVAPDENVRARIDRAINDNEVCDVNPFGVAGLIAAYNEGEPWLDALVEYLYGNAVYLKERFASELPEAKVMPLESTYLAWIDIRAFGMSSDEIASYLHDCAGVRINSGSKYGGGGEGYIRINFACPRKSLEAALDRIIKALGSL